MDEWSTEGKCEYKVVKECEGQRGHDVSLGCSFGKCTAHKLRVQAQRLKLGVTGRCCVLWAVEAECVQHEMLPCL